MSKQEQSFIAFSAFVFIAGLVVLGAILATLFTIIANL